MLDLADVEDWWRTAFSANPSIPPQQSFEWMSTWSKYYAPTSCRVYAIYDGANLRAVLPVSDDGRKPSMPMSVPTGINDSFTVITGNGGQELEAGASAITATLDMRRGRPLYLESVDPVLFPMAKRIDPKFQCLVTRWQTNPRIELPADWETYLNQLTKKQRANVRRSVRRADEGNMSFRFLDEAEAVAETIRFSLAQRRRVWSDHDFYEETSPMQKEPRWDEFLVDAARSMAAAGLAVSGELTMDGEIVAAGLLLQRHDRLLGFHRSSERSQMRFGGIFDALAIRAAIERGKRTMYLGRGPEDYKYQLGVVDTPLCDVVVGHANLASLATIATRVAPDLVRGFLSDFR
jgi:CelD/BcsL family acetyltransferase involved in cellulose biosynthesis